MRPVRARSLEFVATTETISPRQVCPRATMSAVEKPLSTSFSAVPALSLVDPATTSGPVSATTRMSARSASLGPGLLVTSAVTAPALRACSSATPT